MTIPFICIDNIKRDRLPIITSLAKQSHQVEKPSPFLSHSHHARGPVNYSIIFYLYDNPAAISDSSGSCIHRSILLCLLYECRDG